ncbi:MAG TPA: hypothetical protein VIK12_08655 [Pengzhenrongella sp.]
MSRHRTSPTARWPRQVIVDCALHVDGRHEHDITFAVVKPARSCPPLSPGSASGCTLFWHNDWL